MRQWQIPGDQPRGDVGESDNNPVHHCRLYQKVTDLPLGADTDDYSFSLKHLKLDFWLSVGGL